MEKKRGYNHGICLFKLFFDLPLVAVIRIIKLCIVHVLELVVGKKLFMIFYDLQLVNKEMWQSSY